MMTNEAALKRLEQKKAEADQIIEYLKQQVALLKEKAILQATLREEKKLRVENAKLKKEIEELKQERIQVEIQSGVKQKPCPFYTPLQAKSVTAENTEQSTPITVSFGAKEQIKKGRRRKGEGKKLEKKEKKPSTAESADAKPIGASHLVLRIGQIINAKKYPDADSLFVEEIDIGEAAPRTVISGLMNHGPLEQKQNRMVILLCNLKPAKMRGVVPQAMVLCTSSPEKVETLAPSDEKRGGVLGDRVTFDAFPGEPDKEINPKKKIWEQVQLDLHAREDCVATCKGIPFEVKRKEVCRAQTMAKSGIK